MLEQVRPVVLPLFATGCPISAFASVADGGAAAMLVGPAKPRSENIAAQVNRAGSDRRKRCVNIADGLVVSQRHRRDGGLEAERGDGCSRRKAGRGTRLINSFTIHSKT